VAMLRDPLAIGVTIFMFVTAIVSLVSCGDLTNLSQLLEGWRKREGLFTYGDRVSSIVGEEW
jgi:hypothetical protein